MGEIMNLNPQITNIENILNEMVVFQIPRYQREYVWKENHIIDLLDDIYNVMDKPDKHFLGSIVLCVDENKKENKIIDGQQRLTTLELCIFSFIYHNLKELSKGDNSQYRHNNEYLIPFIETKDTFLGSKQKLDIQDPLYQYLCELFTSCTDEDALSEIEDKINEGLSQKNKYIIALNTINNYIMQLPPEKYIPFQQAFFRTIVFKIVTYDEVTSYSIFEILNARGVQLKQIELLKNYIFRCVKSGNTIDKCKKDWDRMEANLKDIDCDTYLQHFVRYYLGENSSKDKAYELIRKTQKKASIPTLYKTMVKDSSLYSDIANCKTTNNYEKRVYNYFRIKNNSQMRTILLALKRKNKSNVINDFDYNNLLTILLNYFVGFNLLHTTSNNIDKKITYYANKIYNSNSYYDALYYFYELMVKIKDFYPNKLELIESLKEIKFSNKNKKGNIRSELLIFIFQPLIGIKDVSNYNIEHIINDSKDDESVWQIGNLIPVPSLLNNKLKNNDIPTKMMLYLESGLDYLKDLAKEYPDFNTNKIATRSTKVISRLINQYYIDYNEIEEKYYNIKAIRQLLSSSSIDITTKEKINDTRYDAIIKNLDNDKVLDDSTNKIIKELMSK